MDYYRAFPFNLGNNHYYNRWDWNGIIEEDRILEDLEYLQQMYPTYSKKYQAVIKGVVDRYDYSGSFIYDQYPDKLTLQQLVNGVMNIIKTEETNRTLPANPANPLSEEATWADKEEWIRELVTVLMFYEVLTRRRRNKRYY